ncbi:DUF1416 domain-containing protein [Mycobacterium tuberculosis]|uniref:DUF1416 domain-containing protein n=6 Tax=Mycobacterium tuberculosis TaxID=1773 RepID=UPI0009223D9E|nr:molybdenum cofactor biosynthesis protein E [Mycobacterium tuberculosis]
MANVVAEGAYPYCRLTDQPLSVDEVLAAVSGPEQGGIVIFVGNVRDHNAGHDVTRLFYEAYPPMVIRTLMSIIGRCEDKAEGGAFVRLLDSSDEFTAEVVASATGDFRFFAAPGSWTLRALSAAGNGDAVVQPSGAGIHEVDVKIT